MVSLKKFTVSFFLLILASQSVFATDKEDLEFQPPSLRLATLEIGLGTALILGIHQVFDPETVESNTCALAGFHGTYAIGAHAIMDGLQSIGQWSYYKLFGTPKPHPKLKVKGNPKRKRLRSSLLDKSRELDLEATHNSWKRTLNIVRQSTGAAGALMTIFHYIVNTESILKKGGASLLFSLKFPDDVHCTNGSFLCSPLITPTIFIMTAGVLGYNLYELSFSLNSRKARLSDNPFAMVCNGLVQTKLSLFVNLLYGRDPRVLSTGLYIPAGSYHDPMATVTHLMELLQKPLPFLPSMVNKVLNLSSVNQYSRAAWQFGRNVYNEINARRIVIEEITPLETPVVRLGEYRERVILPSPSPFVSSPLSSVHADQKVSAQKAGQLTGQSEERSSGGRIKEKTRGVANLSRARVAYINSIPQAGKKEDFGGVFPVSGPEGRRLAGLEEVRRLRTARQVKTQEIDHALDTLIKFLPGGKLKPIIGSEWSIVWEGLRGTQNRIKYERPHGRDNNQFRGHKLERVLNAIEVSYIWGWNSTDISLYMVQCPNSGLNNIPKVLLTALMTRLDT